MSATIGGLTGANITAENGHISVLLDQVVSGLAHRPNGRYLDGTLGSGGHAAALLDATGPNSHLLGLDVDEAALARAGQRLAAFAGRATLVRSNFDQLAEMAEAYGFAPVDSILLDLGVSSPQLAEPSFGLSFRLDGPLDMRLDSRLTMTAGDLVNTLDERALADIFFKYGEESHGRRFARAIVRARPLSTTRELAAVIEGLVPAHGQRIHPATKVFQALRIAVNDELGVLERALDGVMRVLAPGGRVGIISFHSLEDRIVKQRFAAEVKPCICPPALPMCACGRKPRLRLITRRPIEATEDEIRVNPRARSAKLRIAERLEGAA